MNEQQPREPDIDEGRIIDHVLGEGTVDDDASMRDAIDRDFELALECGELRTMFDEMKSLSVEPSGRVELAVRYAVQRRQQLRGRGSERRWTPLRVGQVAAIAATLLCGFVFVANVSRTEARNAGGRSVAPVAFTADTISSPRTGKRDPELDALLAATSLPVRDVTFIESFERFQALEVPDSFSGWISAADNLAELREQFRLRFAPDERREVLHAIGAPNLDARLGALATTVAHRIGRDLRARQASTADLSLSVRAMLAAGSSRATGPHRESVRACVAELVSRLGLVDEADTATALAGLSDIAIHEGRGQLVELVGMYADALARDTLRPRERGRPRLLHWQTDQSQLADAGRVLRLAPAFGVHAGVAFRARMMIVAHLDERVQTKSEVERPGLIAAQVYGFGDLIDLDEADRALRLWNPSLLVPRFVALHHLAWSKVPARPGWAEFQQHLRRLSGVSTPESTGDAAALLLCLTMNFASPGVLASLVDLERA